MGLHLDVLSTRPVDGEADWKTLDKWLGTYWSGLDARVYAGNILLDELVELQWGLQEAVRPLFGYSDYVYRRSLHGVRRVQGAFTLNFKRSSYLFELLRTLNNPELTGSRRHTPGPNTPASRLARTGTATLEDFVALSTEDPVKPAKPQSGFVISKDRKNAAQLRSVQEAFEAAIWGGDVVGAGLGLGSTLGDPTKVKLPQAAEGALKFAARDKPRFGLQLPFDLNIQFGSVAPEELERRRQAAAAAGRPGDPGRIPVSTYRQLVGVDLTGNQTVYDDSGRPIVEVFTFIAQDAI